LAVLDFYLLKEYRFAFPLTIVNQQKSRFLFIEAAFSFLA
jgi:hypothetical protein